LDIRRKNYTIAELEGHLTFFDKASKDYARYSRSSSEHDQECAGSISDDLIELLDKKLSD